MRIVENSSTGCKGGGSEGGEPGAEASQHGACSSAGDLCGCPDAGSVSLCSTKATLAAEHCMRGAARAKQEPALPKEANGAEKR